MVGDRGRKKAEEKEVECKRESEKEHTGKRCKVDSRREGQQTNGGGKVRKWELEKGAAADARLHFSPSVLLGPPFYVQMANKSFNSVWMLAADLPARVVLYVQDAQGVDFNLMPALLRFESLGFSSALTAWVVIQPGTTSGRSELLFKGFIAMNTRQVIDESVGPYSLSANFNHDSSCFSVGLDTGRFDEVFSADPCELKVSRDFNAGIGVVEMLGQSNYLAIVGGGKQPKFPQNKLVIWDDAKQKAVITLEFRTSVLGVRLSKSRIVVTLLNSIHIFAFTNPPQKLSVFETSDNPLGLACLGQKLLAFPGRSPGQVQLVELETGNVSIIPAHSTPLRAMTLSPDGEVLATASEAGTLVRVYSTSNCAKIAELRRGVDHAVIFSLAISPSNALLAVTSDKSTLHIFDLPHPRALSRRSQSPSPASDEVTNQKWGILGKIPLLPRVFSDIYSFASAHFEMGDETPPGSHYASPPLGSSLARSPKGVIGWLDERTIVVIGSGREGRWEKFVLRDGDDGRRHCIREGWKRYLGGG
ncbi:hypothetical protein ASPZODRAFT_14472 [Penicilliopsis zonata CBS 506.65]|uniref:Anaphase-promoting complex subunit 4 WD40 domain-containing protein n=1 Tax=Penicilliopsis zonata CBS 506.65 TaxID=1073090 RepID=A0A1L9SMA4_9EURO|nr:hypothetical protein ASPZODRAFT_14472 [Penicilliopsis zonata CBS 506.65]OJJ48330.1 hypothetical protein ASPZODRAFT_14472 [Penicilliopsis zonata CBS 506.65]